MAELEHEDVPHLFDRLDVAIDIVFGSLAGFLIAQDFAHIFASGGDRVANGLDLSLVGGFTVIYVAIIKAASFLVRIGKTAVAWSAFLMFFATNTVMIYGFRFLGKQDLYVSYQSIEMVLIVWLFSSLLITNALKVFLKTKVA